MQFNFASQYNFAADSLKFSDVSFSARTLALKFLNLSTSARFTLYDEEKIFNDGEFVRFNKVNQYLINNNKGLARLTNLSLSLSTNYSSDGFGFGSKDKDEFIDSTEVNTVLGDRFSARHHGQHNTFDPYGEHSYGYEKMSIPWDINLSLSFNYSNFIVNQISRTLQINSSFNVQLTDTWKLSSNFYYDVIENKLNSSEFVLTKDLHEWNLYFRWNPVGIAKGFYLTFGIKASHLKDLMLKKQNNSLY